MNTRIVEARKNIYSLLSSLFLEPPTYSLLQSILSEYGNRVKGESRETLDQALADFIDACRVTDADTLTREYNNLFVVPVGGYVAPYESVFLDERMLGNKKVSGLLMGPSAIDVKKWYRQAGMELSGSVKEMPDHIGIEIRFMAHLCEKELEAETNGDHELIFKIQDTQLGFLETHLTKWIDPLVEKVQSNTTSTFYIALCEITRLLLQEDFVSLQKEATNIHNEAAKRNGRIQPEWAVDFERNE